MGRLTGRVALITGAGSGIGLATAELFAREGAFVVMSDIDAFKVGVESSRLIEEGLAVSSTLLDVTSEADWDRIIADITLRHGRVDVLVNNAGIASMKNVEECNLQEWRRVLAVNLDGVFLGTRKVIGAMKSDGGSIVNVSSIEGLIGEPNLPAYNASKGGVRLFTKSVALHCAAQGYCIRVNSIHPGYVFTPMVANALDTLPAEQSIASQQEIISRIPMGRLADPKEIAQAILFLASEDSSYITGSELVVDGGYTAK